MHPDEQYPELADAPERADWKPPIAFVPGHTADCYDAAGNFRKCAAGCPADATWKDPDVRGRAYADYDLAEKSAQRQRPAPKDT